MGLKALLAHLRIPAVPHLQQPTMPAGCYFVNVTNDCVVTRQTGSGAHWSYTVKPGANAYGVCQNSSCCRHNKEVLHPRGDGRLNVVTMEAKCPVCSESFEVTNMFFYKCKWTTDYQKRAKGKLDPPGEGKYSTTTQETVTGDIYKKFEDGEMLLYTHLTFNSESL